MGYPFGEKSQGVLAGVVAPRYRDLGSRFLSG